jgi:hypothetical protein
MTRNRSIALGLTILVAVVSATAAVAVICWPEESLRRFDTAWLRAILLLGCSLFASLVALNLYTLWYDPPAIRMMKYAMYFIMGAGSIASITPFGLKGVQRFQGLGVEITTQEAGNATAVCLAVTFSALFFFAILYCVCYYADKFALEFSPRAE